MPHANGPLLHAIVADFSHPDPACALRHRPFVYRSTRGRAGDGVPAMRFRLRFPSFGGTLSSLPRWLPLPRPAARRRAPACC
jgi:hypothetical protein